MKKASWKDLEKLIFYLEFKTINIRVFSYLESEFSE